MANLSDASGKFTFAPDFVKKHGKVIQEWIDTHSFSGDYGFGFNDGELDAEGSISFWGSGRYTFSDTLSSMGIGWLHDDEARPTNFDENRAIKALGKALAEAGSSVFVEYTDYESGFEVFYKATSTLRYKSAEEFEVEEDVKELDYNYRTITDAGFEEVAYDFSKEEDRAKFLEDVEEQDSDNLAELDITVDEFCGEIVRNVLADETHDGILLVWESEEGFNYLLDLSEITVRRSVAKVMAEIELQFFSMGDSLSELMFSLLEWAGEDEHYEDVCRYHEDPDCDRRTALEKTFEVILKGENAVRFVKDWLTGYAENFGDLEYCLSEGRGVIDAAKTLIDYAKANNILSEGADVLEAFVEQAEKRSLSTILAADKVGNTYWRYVSDSVAKVRSNDFHTTGHVVVESDDLLKERGGIEGAEYICHFNCDQKGSDRKKFGIFFSDAGEAVRVDIMKVVDDPEHYIGFWCTKYTDRLDIFKFRKDEDLKKTAEMLAGRINSLAGAAA